MNYANLISVINFELILSKFHPFLETMVSPNMKINGTNLTVYT